MKKFIAFALILTCVLSLFSCGDSVADRVDKMFKSVAPTKVITEINEDIGSITLVSKYTLISGTVDGVAAATYEFSEMTLRTIDEGAVDTELLPWVETTGFWEYHDDKGLRTDGKKWDSDGENFAPKVGSGALKKISKKLMTKVEEDKAAKTINFTVLAADTKTVFGEEIKSDVAVTVTHDGVLVTGVQLSYKVPASDKDHPDVKTTVNILYSYDAEKPNLK